MNLGVRVGQGCGKILDAKMRDLTCHFLQFDEIWGFIGKKEKHRMITDDPTLGDLWTFCATDAETKIGPSFKCGKRIHVTTNAFVGETVPIKEEFQGQTVWEGEVDVFDLHDHPHTHRVCAWAHETEDADHPRRHVTVLHIPPATSPRKAVQASIVSDYREQKGHAES